MHTAAWAKADVYAICPFSYRCMNTKKVRMLQCTASRHSAGHPACSSSHTEVKQNLRLSRAGWPRRALPLQAPLNQKDRKSTEDLGGGLGVIRETSTKNRETERGRMVEFTPCALYLIHRTRTEVSAVIQARINGTETVQEQSSLHLIADTHNANS